jgi:hypothetical protein
MDFNLQDMNFIHLRRAFARWQPGEKKIVSFVPFRFYLAV